MAGGWAVTRAALTPTRPTRESLVATSARALRFVRAASASAEGDGNGTGARHLLPCQLPPTTPVGLGLGLGLVSSATATSAADAGPSPAPPFLDSNPNSSFPRQHLPPCWIPPRRCSIEAITPMERRQAQLMVWLLHRSKQRSCPVSDMMILRVVPSEPHFLWYNIGYEEKGLWKW
ncbi:uncharacterized protein LOC110435626 [Sorghum bicolor]|uniref:uncharacterized protein LOC110435626 n=1 Tax=Sorghum bicolor TaxID=4558 RepID=UPI000B425148|nr:uncharacterized protein LOC110435626 [Sorghum bicolor]|eukprot:XP_021317047.1 uncharacterized protein LOC110435626 [Sorghum bicolor]